MDSERDVHTKILTFRPKLLIEKRRKYNLETHLLFIDYGKAFDSTQR